MDYLASHKKQKVEDMKKDFLDFQNRRRMYQKTFGSETGRMVLKDQLNSSYFFRTSFTGNSQSYYQEGERGKLLDILSYIPEIAGQVIWEWCKDQETALDDYQRHMLLELDMKE